jgi:type I restriction enzyme R subunit
MLFDMISEPLNDYQRADLKKKFSRANQLNIAEQKIYLICWDISFHFRDNFQGRTPLKGQLVCQNKVSAIQYKEFLDEIGIVSTELLISPPDEREGEDSAYGETPEKVKRFWKKMMDEHGTPAKYQKNLINRFKKAEHPEIIIVVDKLLTGFDEPKNTVLYLTRNLNGHTLLQAIARVNRIYPDKEYGYIIDYYGVIEELDNALKLYSSLAEFDDADLSGTLTNITEEIRKLPQKHAELWDLFKTIQNKRDAEAYQLLLKDDALRMIFYDKLASFAKILKLALSSIAFHKETAPDLLARYKNDLTFFVHLRNSVLQRYSDTVNYKQYEGQIQKLIDTHITSDKVVPITSLVNIFDKEKFQQEVEQTTGKAAKADTIASRTAKHISEKMEEDPAFYKKFSQMLKEVIAAYETKRITETSYLDRVREIMDNVLAHTDSDIPDSLQGMDVARAFYGLMHQVLTEKMNEAGAIREIASSAAIAIDNIIRERLKVNWQNEIDIPKKMNLLIGDYLIDEVRDKYNLDLSFDEIDSIADDCVKVSKIRYAR